MGALISTVIAFVRPSHPHVLRTCYDISLPPKVHQIVSESVLNGFRHVFVIGDVHGCAEELELLLSEANANDNHTLKIFAGDMVNKGPDSPKVLHMMQAMPHFAVRGNNEEAVLRECRNRDVDRTYKLPGKYKWIEQLSRSDIQYMADLPYSLLLPSLNSIVVHAGLVPGKPLWAQHPVDMVSMRNLIVGDYFDEGGIQAVSEVDVGTAWATLWPGPQHVYFGHDAVRKLQRHPHATGLDTGCVYGGQLTGIFIHGERKGEIISIWAKEKYKRSKATTPPLTPTS